MTRSSQNLSPPTLRDSALRSGFPTSPSTPRRGPGTQGRGPQGRARPPPAGSHQAPLGGPPVDPGGIETHPLGRHVVVEEALGHMQYLLGRRPDPLQGQLEVVRRGLVGAGLLGGDDVVELHLQVPGRQGEQPVVYVRDDRQLVGGLRARRAFTVSGNGSQYLTESGSASTSEGLGSKPHLLPASRTSSPSTSRYLT